MTLMDMQPRAHRLSDIMSRAIDMDLTELWMKAIKSVLSLLILTILIALTGGVIKTFLDIKLLMSVPVVVLFLVLQKYFVRALTEGAVKH